VHTLLHIADGIKACGPVWAYWAFPMERYCGALQPAIKSRRHPYPLIDRYIVAQAQLTQIKLRYEIAEQLQLKALKSDTVKGALSDLACKLLLFMIGFHQIPILTNFPDPTCILLTPWRPSSSIPPSVIDKIAVSLTTQFSKSLAQIHQHFSIDNVEQWGRVQHLEGGDDMYASSLTKKTEDYRDATFVQVCSFVITTQ
jgi:hypothetical protein